MDEVTLWWCAECRHAGIIVRLPKQSAASVAQFTRTAHNMLSDYRCEALPNRVILAPDGNIGPMEKSDA